MIRWVVWTENYNFFRNNGSSQWNGRCNLKRVVLHFGPALRSVCQLWVEHFKFRMNQPDRECCLFNQCSWLMELRNSVKWNGRTPKPRNYAEESPQLSQLHRRSTAHFMKQGTKKTGNSTNFDTDTAHNSAKYFLFVTPNHMACTCTSHAAPGDAHVQKRIHIILVFLHTFHLYICP